MASEVSVSTTSIQGGIQCCKVSIQELENSIKKLIQSYQMAGSRGWQDQKYVALGRIVEDCCMAMKTPTGELQDCIVKLEELLKIVTEYENSSL